MKHSFKRTLTNALATFKKGYNRVATTLVVTALTVAPAAAADTPKLVTGTVELFRAATTWLLIIIPVGAGLFLGIHAIQKALSTDQAVIAEKNKLMKNVLIGAAIAETASGLATIFLSFYN